MTAACSISVTTSCAVRPIGLNKIPSAISKSTPAAYSATEWTKIALTEKQVKALHANCNQSWIEDLKSVSIMRPSSSRNSR